MQQLSLPELRDLRKQSIEDCLSAFGLPPTTTYHAELLLLDLLPAKPSKQFAFLILTYKQECTVETLKTISDQPAGIVKRLRNLGFNFKSHPTDPRKFHFHNVDGALCRQILYFASPKVQPRGRAKEFLEKSVSACVSAIEVYNKPDFKYREETFAILMINAWELMLKAKLLMDDKNNLRSIMVYDKDGNAKKSRSGNFLTIELMGAVGKLVGLGSLDLRCRQNIELLVEIRDSAIHFINDDVNFQKKVMEIGTASLQNYLNAAKEWFNKDLSKYNFFLMPLSFFPPSEVKDHVISDDSELARLLKFIYEVERQYPSNVESNYNVTLSYEVKIKRATDPDYQIFVTAPTEDGVPLRMHEEDLIKTKYQWSFAILVEKLKARYSDFKQNQRFNDLKKEIERTGGERVSHVRYLNSLEQKGSKQRFYSPEIIKEFDKHYTKK